MDDDYYKVLLFLHICMACVIGWVAKPNTLFSSNQRTTSQNSIWHPTANGRYLFHCFSPNATP